MGNTCSDDMLVLWGKKFIFSGDFVDLVSHKIPDFKVSRFTKASDLSRVVEAAPECLVIHQDIFAELLDLPASEKRAFCNKRIVVTYSDVTSAKKLLRKCDCADLSFVAVNLQLDHWLSIVRMAICGQRFIAAELLEGMDAAESVAPVRGDTPPAKSGLPANLTGRELEVLQLVAEGKQNKVVAHQLRLSENTVKIHVHNIISKLKVSNRTEAANMYHGGLQTYAQ